MDLLVRACAECTQTCCLIHGNNKSNAVTSFFKIMIGDHFLNLLFLPPKFACWAPVKDGQTAILEDSSGQIWEVKFQKSNKNLVFQQGWDTFASDHNIQVGELLLFFLTKQWHFVVKIYDRTSCEKLDFSEQTKKRKRKRKRKTRQTPNEKTERYSDSDVAVETNCRVPAHKEDPPGDEMYFMIGRDSDEAERGVSRRFNFDEWMNEATDNVACVERPLIVFDDRDDDDDDVYDVAKEASSGGVSDKVSSSFAAISTLLATNVVNPEEKNEARMKSTEIIELLFDDEGSKENISDSEIKRFLVGEENDRILPSNDRDLDDENHQCTEKVFNEISGTSDVPENCQPGDDQILLSRECDADNENQECTKNVVNEISETSDIPENCQSGNDRILPSPECNWDNDYQQCIEKVVNGISGTPNISENCQLGEIIKSNPEEFATIQTDPCNNEATKKPHGKTVVKKEIVNSDPVETKFYSHSCKTTSKLGESSKIAKRSRGQSVDTAESDHNRVHPVVVKTEIVDSDKNYATTTNDQIKFPPMLAICAHKHFIELPDTLPFPKIKGRANMEKKIVYLRDSAMNLWPVLYHEKQATQFLKSGLDNLIEANRIKPGDNCLFTIEDEAEGIYSLRVV